MRCACFVPRFLTFFLDFALHFCFYLILVHGVSDIGVISRVPYPQQFRTVNNLTKRDSNGLWITGFAKPTTTFFSLAAELFALREGLALCVELQAQAVEVELDASAAISLISCNITSNGDLSVLVDDCREFLLQLPQARMTHCYREANCCADALAKLGANLSSACNRFNSPPPVAIPFLLVDSLGTARTRMVPFGSCNSSS